MKKFIIFLLFVINSLDMKAQPINWVEYLTVPGFKEYANIDTQQYSILPSGRYVRPAGKTFRITHDPFGLAISPDQRVAVTLHENVFSIIDLTTNQIRRVPDYNSIEKGPLEKGSFLGVTFHTKQPWVLLSGGDAGTVIIYDYTSGKRIDTLLLDGVFNKIKYSGSFTSDLAIIPGTDELLVLDRGNFRLVKFNLRTRKMVASIPTGRQPFGLAVAPDGKTALVANVGMYSYPLVEGTTPDNIQSQYIPWHPYGNNTKASREGTEIAGKKIPGLGDPNSPESMSVFIIDLTKNSIQAKIKTGMLLGEMLEEAEVIGGASPNSIAINEAYAYVTNATNDNIAVIDYKKGQLLRHIPITVHPLIDKLRGVVPFGIELSKDNRYVFVALLGLNAVAKIDVNTNETVGLIPTGWGTTRVRVSANNEQLFITSCRGYGAGPNGGKGFVTPIQGTYIGDIQLGTFQIVNNPDSIQLSKYTRQVIEQTFVVNKAPDNTPLPVLPGSKISPIKHIVYVTKENRTFDEVFGQMPEVMGDSTLARFGIGVNVISKNKQAFHVNVAPNHLKIARQFSLSDNYYCDSDASIHGHHWMMGVIPNEWVEANSSTEKTADYFSSAPGRRFPGSTGSMDPEDYSEIGGLWEALDRKKISYYNFGQANETAHVREDWADTATGAAHIVMVPMQKGVWENTSHNFAGYNTNIPDQFRMKQFEEEFSKKWLQGKDSLPQLITVMLPNDHTAKPRPADGYPFIHSYMADNDLALGRLLHFLSRTPYWKDMLVIITEDDPQGGVDHIDAHRSILMMAGPYVKKNYVSRTHANFGSILKVIYNILGVPYVNQYDKTASLLSDFFTNEPDNSPYYFEFPSQEVFDWDKAMKKFNRTIDWRKVKQGPQMDDEKEQRSDHYKTSGQKIEQN
ncbi:MAG: phosphoesterase [Chitinophagia bacterium]|nr:phosphoesterase [Chitinophagia bacterium]